VSSLQAKSVLVLWGRQDKILEPSVVERLGQELPQARITFVENCGTIVTQDIQTHDTGT
jgi:pimeloyl-ACP methyl ester carboxylesterase